MRLLHSTFVAEHFSIFASLFTQVLLPTPMPTLAEAVDPINLRVWPAVEVSHLYSAVIVLEYTTADQEMKLE